MLGMVGSNNLVIIGAGGQSRVCIDILESVNIRPELVLGDPGSPKNIYGVPVEVGYERLEKLTSQGFSNVLIAIGDNNSRQTRAEQCTSEGLRLFSAISSNASISTSASVGAGSVVNHGARIGPSVEISPLSILGTYAVVGHDSKLGTSVHIAGQTILGGGCEIGDRVLIGLGSVVLPKIHVGSDITVGAGSVVSRSLEEPGVYIGSPARLVKKWPDL